MDGPDGHFPSHGVLSVCLLQVVVYGSRERERQGRYVPFDTDHADFLLVSYYNAYGMAVEHQMR